MIKKKSMLIYSIVLILLVSCTDQDGNENNYIETSGNYSDVPFDNVLANMTLREDPRFNPDIDPGIIPDHLQCSNYLDYSQIGVLSVDGFSIDDINQKVLSDCTFLSTLASLTYHNPEWVKKMIVKDAIRPDVYSVHLFDYNANRWIWVAVNTNLPTYFSCVNDQLGPPPDYGYSKGFIFDPKNISIKYYEIWPSLIEKAFAKWSYGIGRNGDYQDIEMLLGSTVYKALFGMGDPTVLLVPNDCKAAWHTTIAALIDSAIVIGGTKGDHPLLGEYHSNHAISFLEYDSAERKIKIRDQAGFPDEVNYKLLSFNDFALVFNKVYILKNPSN